MAQPERYDALVIGAGLSGLAAGIRLGSGHVTFSRPLVVPMALGAAGLDEGRGEVATETDRVKAASGASENYGNFFGQNLFFGAAGVALVVSVLDEHGLTVDPRHVSSWAVPVAIASVVVAAAQYWLLDRWLRRRGATRGRRDPSTVPTPDGSSTAEARSRQT